jgi:hypothetical protein
MLVPAGLHLLVTALLLIACRGVVLAWQLPGRARPAPGRQHVAGP